MNIETFEYNTEAWVEEIFKGMNRHQNAKCIYCSMTGYLRRDCRQGIPGNNVCSGMAKIKSINFLDYVEGMAKVDIGPMNTEQQKDRQGNPIPLGNSLRGPLTGPQVKCGPVISSHCGGHVSPGKFKNPEPSGKKNILFWMMG